MLSRHDSCRWEFPVNGISWIADPLLPGDQFELCYCSLGLVFLLYGSTSREDKLYLLYLLVAGMLPNISLIKGGERLHISILYLSVDLCHKVQYCPKYL